MSLSPFHVVIILVLGVLFFGRNLPEVAKQIGSSLLEFRKGLDEWKEVRVHGKGGGRSADSGTESEESVERFEMLGTKFEPPSDGG